MLGWKKLRTYSTLYFVVMPLYCRQQQQHRKMITTVTALHYRQMDLRYKKIYAEKGEELRAKVSKKTNEQNIMRTLKIITFYVGFVHPRYYRC